MAESGKQSIFDITQQADEKESIRWPLAYGVRVHMLPQAAIYKYFHKSDFSFF